ncbi:MAG: ketoacyl-ACP synthase III [Salinivirgaceae bacterium]|nr:ketoacyl-ACP synthase III [Salinivirgaceae bacterium]
MLPIKIKSTGIYVPGEPITNKELIELTGADLNAEKLEKKLGIYQRHMAHLRGIKETTADFATKACENALQNTGIDANDIGLFIVASDTPEYISPATTLIVQGRLQKKEVWASSFDVNASCASFAIAFDNAVRIMATDETINYALVVGVYNMPAYLRKDDMFGYSIFADGAGAFLLERNSDGKQGYISGQNLTDGTQYDYIGVYAGGTKMPVTKELLNENKQGLLSLKPLPGDRNVRLWPMVVNKLLQKSNTNIEEIDHFIFTQINKYVIEQVMEALQLPIEKTSFSMDKYGYTGSACLPITFHEAINKGNIKRGDKIMMVASGAGLAVGSNLFIY